MLLVYKLPALSKALARLKPWLDKDELATVSEHLMLGRVIVVWDNLGGYGTFSPDYTVAEVVELMGIME